MQQKAEALATSEDSDPALLFAADESFNPGVVGLAASRLVEAYYRPAVVAAKGPEETRGSCRSIPSSTLPMPWISAPISSFVMAGTPLPRVSRSETSTCPN